jgi:4-hydroxy-tetrahydrodipicolinate synthase
MTVRRAAVLRRNLHPGKVSLFGGHREGGDGTISPAANVFPSLMVKMFDLVKQCDIEGAKRISDMLASLREAWAWGSFPVVIKEAMALVGRSAGETRWPIQPLSSERQNDLAKVIEKIRSAGATG